LGRVAFRLEYDDSAQHTKQDLNPELKSVHLPCTTFWRHWLPGIIEQEILKLANMDHAQGGFSVCAQRKQT
jgi:hypothetical protein